ncbi:MAG: hypothetical protein ACKVQU_25935 [Burkholderiales bacterium]
MNRLGFLAYAANFAPRIAKVRGSTWVAFAVGLLLLFAVAIWAGLALIGWLWGHVQTLSGPASDSVRSATQGVIEQAGKMVPGAREKLGELIPALKEDASATESLRDVSGSDLGPVERYPGLVRISWQKNGAQAVVEYGGKADYTSVLGHYAKAFAALGYTQSVESATQDTERHTYTKQGERLIFAIAQPSKGGVRVRIETTL